MPSSNRSYRPDRNHSPIGQNRTAEKQLVVFRDDDIAMPGKQGAQVDKSPQGTVHSSNAAWAVLGAVLPIIAMPILLFAGSGEAEGDFRERLKWMVFGMIGVMAAVLLVYVAFLVLSGATVDGTVSI